MDLIKKIINTLNGGSSILTKNILFENKKPNTRLFAFLLYLDSIHDFPEMTLNIDELLKKLNNTKLLRAK